MSPAVSLTTPDEKRPDAKTLSITIEPSPPIILDIVQLFLAHNQLDQAIELCQAGLKVFPQDMRLRLGMAVAYLDLKEKDKAWAEIKSVAQELKNLAPTLGIIAEHTRQFGEARLSEWFSLISKTLAKYPEGGQEAMVASPVVEKLPPEELKPPLPVLTPQEEPTFSFQRPNQDETGPRENAPLDSKVLSTLNNWLSQLKEDKP